MIAQRHPNQTERLGVLRSYEILDTPRESDFDEIVDLVSRICETPISVINLIDADRQWFKAEVGLGVRETPLETSICSHVILQDDFVEIPDTLADPRMADNPLCLSDADGLRFYAGALLRDESGLPIGTLCVLDTKPRTLNDLQRQALRVLAQQVMKQLEMRRAARIQESLRNETDHRIKNALQSVSSVVRLYSRTVSDPAGTEALGAVQRRIDAMSAIHEQLQRKSHGETVEMADYLDRIGTLLTNGAPDGISVTNSCDDFALPTVSATAIGMIASEFCANAIKHGFENREGGRVDITLRKGSNGTVMLECVDDGVGNAGPAQSPSKDSLGKRLMQAAATQLGGTMDLSLTPKGARLRLDFSAPAIAPAA